MSDLFNFKDWLANLDKLTDDQRAELFKRLAAKDEEKNRTIKNKRLLQNEKGSIVACPHCGSASVGRHGTKDGKQRYRCKDCKKTFVETTGTFFKHSHLEEWQWKEIIRGVLQNLSAEQIAEAIGTSRKTAWLGKNKIMQLVSVVFGEQDRFTDVNVNEFLSHTPANF